MGQTKIRLTEDEVDFVQALHIGQDPTSRVNVSDFYESLKRSKTSPRNNESSHGGHSIKLVTPEMAIETLQTSSSFTEKQIMYNDSPTSKHYINDYYLFTHVYISVYTQ